MKKVLRMHIFALCLFISTTARPFTTNLAGLAAIPFAWGGGQLTSKIFNGDDAGFFTPLGVLGGVLSGATSFALFYLTTRPSKYHRAKDLVRWSENDASHLNAIIDLLPQNPIYDATEAQEFYRVIETGYVNNSFPLVSVLHTYQRLYNRINKAINLLNGAQGTWRDSWFAVDEEEFQETCEDIKKEIKSTLAIINNALIAIKKHPKYYEQSQAYSAQQAAEMQRGIRNEMMWNNLHNLHLHNQMMQNHWQMMHNNTIHNN